MTDFYDLTTRKTEQIQKKGTEIGWSLETYQLKRNYIDANDLSKIKDQARTSNADLQIYVGKRTQEKIREVSQLSEIDIIQNPGKNKKFRGVDKPAAENAQKNQVMLLYTFKYIKKGTKKERAQKISDIRETIKICEKYGTKYNISTGAQNQQDIRSPHNLKIFVENLGGRGKMSMQEWPKEKIKGE